MTTATTNLSHLDFVAVEFRSNIGHEFSTREGFYTDDCGLSVGGCKPSAGMIGRYLSQPYRQRGGDLWTMSRGDVVAVLGDGTEVRLGEQIQNVHQFEAAGKTYKSILSAALDITPVI